MAKRRGNQEGSIWKERESWRAAISLDENRVTKSFKSKAECQAWIREMQNQVDKGLSFNSFQVTLAEYIDRWLSIHTSQLRRKTGPQYYQLTTDYILPCIGKYKLKDLHVDQIEGLYQRLLKNGKGVRTVRYVHAVLHRCLKDAVKRGLIGINPAHGATLPRLEQNEMRIMDEA
jgi:integrase